MWLEKLRRRFGFSGKKSSARGKSRTARNQTSTNLQIENLEDRTVPAVFKVTSLLDNTSPVITTGHTGTMANPYLAPSLRSAISAANASPGGNIIDLAVAGTYSIALTGGSQGNNASGEFDILPSGGNLTITNTSGGAAVVNGNNLNRVFDINPNPNPATAPFTVLMHDFSIENGDANGTSSSMKSGGGIQDCGNASLT
ncbi:MAG TPA: hypothetical protein VG097_04370, partial [Gemmata sp.]|nr:hypothetical protein [Gemmata sp.]